MRLERILETVLYYSSGQDDELARFYGEVLGLQAVGRGGLTFRVGDGLLLLFDADLSSAQSADDLIAHFRTTSHYLQIDPAKRGAFEDEDRRRIEARGGVVHSSSATVLMTAQRRL
jgi:hypothetical protein